MIINRIQESCIDLFLIDLPNNYYLFHLKILYFQKVLIQSFLIFKYGLLIKILNR